MVWQTSSILFQYNLLSRKQGEQMSLVQHSKLWSCNLFSSRVPSIRNIFWVFCFHGVERLDQKPLHRKMPFVHDTKIILHWYQILLPLIRSHLLIVVLQLEVVISTLFRHRLWLPITFQRYCHVIRYALKSQILLFCTIAHAGLCKFWTTTVN